MVDATRTRLTTALGLFAFTLLAFAIHGYHYGIEDEAIYLPAIKKIIDPTLYPRGSEFFMGQARGTVLPWVIAGVTRATHASLPWVVLITQFVSIFLFLFGCWMVASRCFAAERERWAAIALVTSLLTLPIAGTSIYLVDQHLHPRTLAYAFLLMAIAWAMSRRVLPCAVLCACAAVAHPLVGPYGIVFVVMLWLPLERWGTVVGALTAIPFLARPTAAWREALATREYYSLRNWDWYEWLGMVAPMLIVWALARVAERKQLPALARLLQRLNLYAAIMLVVTLIVALPRATEFLSPLQPFRYLHTVYLLMIMAVAGLLARWSMKALAVLAVVLAVVMGAVQLLQFVIRGGAPHIDIPGTTNDNAYVQCFLWVRDHTPKDAYFALDPEYMLYSDNYGFRALAERSQMADISKDAGVVTVSPQLATEWKREVDSTRRWEKFNAEDFARLRRDFGVEWVILGTSPVKGLDCVFVAARGFDEAAQVCHISAPGAR